MKIVVYRNRNSFLEKFHEKASECRLLLTPREFIALTKTYGNILTGRVYVA